MDDDLRHLVSLISDTGMRLSEAAGLMKSDFNVDCDYPHLVIQPTLPSFFKDIIQ